MSLILGSAINTNGSPEKPAAICELRKLNVSVEPFPHVVHLSSLRRSTTQSCAIRSHLVRRALALRGFRSTGATKTTHVCSMNDRPGAPYSTLFIASSLSTGAGSSSLRSGTRRVARSPRQKRVTFPIAKTASTKSERRSEKLNMSHTNCGCEWISIRGNWDTTGEFTSITRADSSPCSSTCVTTRRTR